MTKFRVVRSIGFLFLLPAFLFLQHPANAADSFVTPNEMVIVAVDATGKAIELPTPHEPLAALIRAGKVRFEFYDPKVTKRSFAGETKFDFRYTYKSKTSWKQVVKDKRPAIELRIQYDDIKLERTHQVSLPQEMIGNDLFDQRLTLHEFDHLRISCDERLPALLEKMLKETNAVIIKTLDQEQDGFKGKPTPQDLSRISKQLVKAESDKVFNEFIAIVSIRYQELDRISNYGLKQLATVDRTRIIDSPPQQK